jgi:hypothetical protein
VKILIAVLKFIFFYFMDIEFEYDKDKSQLYKGSIPGPILESILIEFRLESRNTDSASILENIDSGVDS